LRPSGKHTRNRAIRYRTSACKDCRLKSRCTSGAQRTIHRLFDQAALDRMEARIYADPSLMVTRRCTVEHPFGTIKRMSGGGRFLTRGLRAVKAEAALDCRLQHPPCSKCLRCRATDASGVRRASLCWWRRIRRMSFCTAWGVPARRGPARPVRARRQGRLSPQTVWDEDGNSMIRTLEARCEGSGLWLEIKCPGGMQSRDHRGIPSIGRIGAKRSRAEPSPVHLCSSSPEGLLSRR
jgi:hypothetical protein